LKSHLQYLSYVIRHKWFVMCECFHYGLIWRGVTHDLGKFLPCEWFPYVNQFYGPDKKAQAIARAKTGYFHVPKEKDPFNYAWLHHLHGNSHHWQHWLLVQDMPFCDVIEMVCDWRGAGRAQGHGDDLVPWYTKNKDKMQLHPETRDLVNALVYGRRWRKDR